MAYTPVWGVAAAIVMVTGVIEGWGDVACMVFGAVFGLSAVVIPVVWKPAGSSQTYRATALKMSLSVVILSFGLNYLQTPYFFDVLHMHYGFNTTINVENNPVFLYFLTCAYFSTYCALSLVTVRWLRARGMRAAAWIVAPISMAFLETILNANPFMTRLFCYDDMALMMWFGTLSYSLSFIFVLPVWVSMDEGSEGGASEATPLWKVSAQMALVLGAVVVCLILLREFVAPHFTDVVDNAVGLRDYADSCLEPPAH